MGSGDIDEITISGICVESGQSTTAKFIPLYGQQNLITFMVSDVMVGSSISLRRTLNFFSQYFLLIILFASHLKTFINE
jgi:hypothetical protein